MSASASTRRRDRAPLGPRIFGGGALLVSVLAFVVAISDLRESRDAEFSPENAAFMPVVITGLWVLLMAAYFVKQLVKPTADYPGKPAPDRRETAHEAVPPAAPGSPHPQDPSDSVEPDDGDVDSDVDHADADPTDVKWVPPVLLVAALVGYVLLLEYLGFMIVTPLFFFAVTKIFGSAKHIRDGIVAALLSWGMYLLFTEVLELSLAQGVWPW